MSEPNELSEQKKAIESAHGPCHFIKVNGELVAFRRPKEAEVERFTNGVASGEQHYGHSKDLVRACCVHPGKDQLATMMRKAPGLVAKVVPVLSEMASDGIEELEKDE